MDYRIREHLKTFTPKGYASIPDIIYSIPKEELIDCSYGINPFGYSEKVEKFLEGISKNSDIKNFISDYPDGRYKMLKEAIAKSLKPTCDIGIDQITTSNGSSGVLYGLANLFGDIGTKVLGFSPQFTSFVAAVEAQGIIYEYITLKEQNNYKFMADEFISAITEEHVLLYIDNPNNPTGQIIPLCEIEKICKAAAKTGATVIVDEAYGDFMPLENSAINLVKENKNVVVFRSLSKGHGLAAIRLGYMVAREEFISIFGRIDMPFTVTTFAQNVAIAALEDKEFTSESMKMISDVKREVLSHFKKFKVWQTDQTVPIFTLMHPDKDVDLFMLFAKHKVFVEPAFGFIAMPKNAARLRIPKDPAALIAVIDKIEASI